MIKLLSRIASWFAEDPESVYEEPCDHEWSESAELLDEFAWVDTRIEGDCIVLPQYELVEQYCENCGEKRGPVEQRDGWTMHPYQKAAELHIPIEKVEPLTESAERSIAASESAAPSSESEVELNTNEHTYKLTD
jgi:hypothetical protein